MHEKAGCDLMVSAFKVIFYSRNSIPKIRRTPVKLSNYTTKIRQKKQLFKHNKTPKKKLATWLWIIVTIVFLITVIFLSFVYKDNLSEAWSNYQNLALPFSFCLIIFLLAMIWFAPKIYVSSLQYKSLNKNQSAFDREKEKLKLENDARKTIAQIVGGIIILSGLLFTYSTYRLNVEKQNLDREGQITDRFTTAVSQLGDEEIAVRLGGLYALERIAKDSPRDRWPIMEIISSYVREKSPRNMSVKPAPKTDLKKQNNSTYDKKLEYRKIKTDVQTALSIVGRGTEQDKFDNRLDLSESNLDGVDLTNAKFTNTDFYGSEFKRAQLISANLDKSNLDFTDFSGAVLVKANLDYSDLCGARFTGANLQRASFKKASAFNDYTTGGEDLPTLSVMVCGRVVDFSNADLTEANFAGARIGDAKFNNTDLTRANFEETELGGADLSGALYVTFEQLREAIIDDETKLPAYLENYRPQLLEISRLKVKKLKNLTPSN
jgi:hypothetical protein